MRCQLLIANYSFVDAQTAFSKSLAYVQSDGTVIIKGDDTSTLPLGAFRDR